MVSRPDLSPEEQAALTVARKTIASYADQMGSMVGMGTDDAGMPTMMLSQTDDTMHEIRSAIERLVAINSDSSIGRARDLVSEGRARERLLMATAIGASIIGVFIALIVTISLVRPLRAVISVVRGLAAGRRETIAPGHASRRDAIGDLARALSVFQQAMA
jgi:hypothetical protein